MQRIIIWIRNNNCSFAWLGDSMYYYQQQSLWVEGTIRKMVCLKERKKTNVNVGTDARFKEQIFSIEYRLLVIIDSSPVLSCYNY